MIGKASNSFQFHILPGNEIDNDNAGNDYGIGSIGNENEKVENENENYRHRFRSINGNPDRESLNCNTRRWHNVDISKNIS
uniref:Uncharacterized protein n=1 Tax=Arundo donax TaxID=35708 RepID=A0A0A9FTW6_ARUDO